MNFSKRTDLHLPRKAWHIAWGLLGALIIHFSKQPQNTVALSLLFLASVVGLFEFLRLKNPSLNHFVQKHLHYFMREHEKEKMTGIFFYLLGAGLSLLFFTHRIASISIFFLIFADPLSSIVGVLYGKKKITPTKSLEGSLSAFFICLTITIICLSLWEKSLNLNMILFTLFAGFFGALGEFSSTWGIDDNLSIPVLSGIGMTLTASLLDLVPL